MKAKVELPSGKTVTVRFADGRDAAFLGERGLQRLDKGDLPTWLRLLRRLVQEKGFDPRSLSEDDLQYLVYAIGRLHVELTKVILEGIIEAEKEKTLH